MIQKRTVLVLGAGASRDAGFPLGRRLLMDICQDLRASTWLERVLIDCGFSAELQKEFKLKLDACGLPSVDAFLENPENQRAFGEIGKAAIAAKLVPNEDHESLMKRREPQLWYEYFFSTILDGKIELPDQLLSVITFNYDRSFEQYLVTALRNAHALSEEDAWRAVQRIPIVHVYGQLGDLRGTVNARSYSPTLDAAQIKVAIKSIKIMHEGEARTDELKSAHALLEQAQVVCFLGFGFHKINADRLRPKLLSGKSVFSTGYEVRKGERELFKSRLPHSDITFADEKLSCLDLLRDYRMFW